MFGGQTQRRRHVMGRSIFEWLWRIAMLCALLWVGYELRGLHADIMAPADEGTTAAADPGELQDSLDAIREALTDLNGKIEVAMAQGK
jgi:hypothetical protein